MEISLQQLCPLFLEQEKIDQSQVWDGSLLWNAGEKIKVVAPSGSGKTSLIHFLYGLRKDFTGSLFFDKKDVRHFTAEETAHIRASKLSIVFQDLRLFANHSVAENIAVKKNLRAFEHAMPVAQMAERLGIANKLDQAADICSYGEQQRISIIRALQQPFDFIILDEPFSHLDDANSRKAMTLIEEEAGKRNAGIILADLSEVEFFKADRILKL